MEVVLDGVTKGAFLSVVTGGGVVRIWDTQRACSRLLANKEVAKVAEVEAELRARDVAEAGEEAAGLKSQERHYNRSMGEEYALGRTPLWRLVSGILPGNDLHAMHPNERAGRLTLLIRAVEKVIRYEWRAFEKTRREGVASQVDDPRVRWWDPMRLVSEHFGIAYSALSRFSREVAGLAASDLTDRVKAETMRTRMKEEVKAWVLAIHKENAKALEDVKADEKADALWSLVAKKRGRGRWSRAAWAARFGYSSYTKFQRACLAEHGVSPVELERAVLEEVLESNALELKVEGTMTTGAVLERESRAGENSGEVGGTGVDARERGEVEVE